jgi:broad specificity phosphatase PhoE
MMSNQGFFSFIRSLAVLILIAVTAPSQAQQLTTFILVRHAEKVMDGSKDPSLTEQGQERAGRLQLLLSKTAIDVVYSTPYRRTHATVEPLAKALGLSVKEYEPRSEGALELMLKEYAGKTLLVSGHSDTVPAIINWLTGSQYKEFDETDYGNIIIVSVTGKGAASKVTWLRY